MNPSTFHFGYGIDSRQGVPFLEGCTTSAPFLDDDFLQPQLPARILKSEFLTPHKISVYVLIMIFCKYHNHPTYTEPLLDILLHECDVRRDFQEPSLDTFFDELCLRCRDDRTGASLGELFLNDLLRIHSEHQLIKFFTQDLRKFVQYEKGSIMVDDENQIRSHMNAKFGVYMRKGILQFEKMTIKPGSVTKFWSSFKHYVITTAPEEIAHVVLHIQQHEHNRRIYIDDAMINEVNSMESKNKRQVIRKMLNTYYSSKGGSYNFGYEEPYDGMVSLWNSERFIESQKKLLERCDAGSIQSNGYLQQKLDIIAKHIPEAFESHFIRYVAHLNNGEFEGSLDAFHRYFDYWVAEHKDDHYQWAVLNLSILYTRFGHIEQASYALGDSITRSLEMKDRECLNLAQNLLGILVSSHTQSPILASLSRTVGRNNPLQGAPARNENPVPEGQNAADDQEQAGHHRLTTVYQLQSLGELERCRTNLLAGDSPTETFESLFRSKTLSRYHPTLQPMNGVTRLLESSIWQLYGNLALSYWYSQCQMHVLNAFPDVNSNLNLEDAVLGYCQLADQLSLQGLLDEALLVLDEARRRFPGSSPAIEGLLIKCAGLILIRQKWAANDIPATRQVLSSLIGAALSDSSLASDLEFLEAKLGVREGRPKEGYERLSRLVETTDLDEPEALGGDNRSQLKQNEYLVALGEMLLTNAPTAALKPTLTTLTLSQRRHLFQLQHTTLFQLSEIQLRLNMIHRASQFIQTMMPNLLAHGDIESQGRVWLLSAKSGLVGLKEVSQEWKRREIVGRVLEDLKKAESAYQTTENIHMLREIYGYQVTCFHVLGNVAERDRVAKMFRGLDRRCKTDSRTLKNVDGKKQ